MNDVKCECGHVNPLGTVICESCGKILVENESNKKLVDMRYEGSARRSQTYNRTIVDKIWNFFSSVKIGVALIVITLIASAIGTILPQEMYIPKNIPAIEHYREYYGWFGELYYRLGFHNLYSQWWYLLLVASIGVSLVICSLDRVIPLYKALKNQRVTRHSSFLKRQRLFASKTKSINDQEFATIIEKLEKKRYNVRTENGNILAEKGRFSRWGPYINHIGLIIFLIGGMLRFVPGMYVDKILWIDEGETKPIPGTDNQYYLKNEEFILEFYDKEKDNKVFEEVLNRVGNIVKNYQTNVVLYKQKGEAIPGAEPELEEVKTFGIQVNKPLKFDDYALYQVDYRTSIKTMTFELTNKETKEEFGTVEIDLTDPKKSYDLGNGYSVEIIRYFPDLGFNDKGEPITISPNPNNPAFIFKMISPEKPEGETSVVAIQETLEPLGENIYKMAFKNVKMENHSALTVRKDLTLWIIGLGGVIFMIGVIQGSYWNHRRIWIQQANGEVMVAGHTNKNWYGLKKEIENVFKDTDLPIPVDQLNNEEKNKSQKGVETDG